MKANVIKFKDMNVANMIAYLDNADIKESQIIRIREDKISCCAHPIDQSFVKYTSVATQDILTFEKLPPNFAGIAFPLYGFKKFKNTLNIYKASGYDKLDGEITFSDTTLGDGLFSVDFVQFKVKGMNIKVKATDSIDIFISDDDWKEFSNTDTHVLKFDANAKFISRLKQIAGVDFEDTDSKKVDLFLMKVNYKTKSLIFSSKKEDLWSIQYTTDDGNIDFKEIPGLDVSGDLVLVVSRKVMELLADTPFVTFYLMQVSDKGYNLVIYANEENVSLVSLIKYDVNIHG